MNITHSGREQGISNDGSQMECGGKVTQRKRSQVQKKLVFCWRVCDKMQPPGSWRVYGVCYRQENLFVNAIDENFVASLER